MNLEGGKSIACVRSLIHKSGCLRADRKSDALKSSSPTAMTSRQLSPDRWQSANHSNTVAIDVREFPLKHASATYSQPRSYSTSPTHSQADSSLTSPGPLYIFL